MHPLAARVVPQKAGAPDAQQREVAALREEVAALTQQLDWFKRQVFGEKSEKRVIDPQIQPDLLGDTHGCAPTPEAAEPSCR